MYELLLFCVVKKRCGIHLIAVNFTMPTETQMIGIHNYLARKLGKHIK